MDKPDPDNPIAKKRVNDSVDPSKSALKGAIKHEIERNAKTLKIEVDTLWVDGLSLHQVKGVWDTMNRVRDAIIAERF